MGIVFGFDKGGIIEITKGNHLSAYFNIPSIIRLQLLSLPGE